MKKLLLLSFLSLILFISINNVVLAQTEKPLEISYPSVPEAPAPTTVKTELPAYIRYVFNFSIWISGFIALVVLVIAGFRYMVSAGRPEIMKDAKDQIFSAILGLAVLLSSWLILTSINPQLKDLQIKKLSVVLPSLQAGTYLCKQDVNEISWIWNRIRELKNMALDDAARESGIKQINEWLKKVNEECWHAPASSNEIPEKFNDLSNATAYTVPSQSGTLYGAILYDESKFYGKAQVVYTLDLEVGPFEVSAINPSSIRTFVLKQPRPESYVEIYELIDFNKADPEKESQQYGLGGELAIGEYIEDFEEVGSVRIEGELIVIFFKEEYSDPEGWPPDAILDVVINTDSNLYDNPMGRWCRRSVWQLFEYYPCPKQMAIVSGGVY